MRDALRSIMSPWRAVRRRWLQWRLHRAMLRRWRRLDPEQRARAAKAISDGAARLRHLEPEPREAEDLLRALGKVGASSKAEEDAES